MRSFLVQINISNPINLDGIKLVEIDHVRLILTASNSTRLKYALFKKIRFLVLSSKL